MRCIVCDRCKAIIEDVRKSRVITCARPLKPGMMCGKGGVPYRGDDPQQNDLIWEKEVCDDCRAALEAFFEAGADPVPDPPADDGEDADGEDGETDP